MVAGLNSFRHEVRGVRRPCDGQNIGVVVGAVGAERNGRRTGQRPKPEIVGLQYGCPLPVGRAVDVRRRRLGRRELAVEHRDAALQPGLLGPQIGAIGPSRLPNVPAVRVQYVPLTVLERRVRVPLPRSVVPPELDVSSGVVDERLRNSRSGLAARMGKAERRVWSLAPIAPRQRTGFARERPALARGEKAKRAAVLRELQVVDRQGTRIARLARRQRPSRRQSGVVEGRGFCSRSGIDAHEREVAGVELTPVPETRAVGQPVRIDALVQDYAHGSTAPRRRRLSPRREGPSGGRQRREQQKRVQARRAPFRLVGAGGSVGPRQRLYAVVHSEQPLHMGQ